MFNEISIRTSSQIGSLEKFFLRYDTNFDESARSLQVVYVEKEDSCVAFIDLALPMKHTYEIRGDGVWFDANCEKQSEHWSFSMESFALQVSVNEYLVARDSSKDLLVGDRIPFGFEIDVESNNGQDWTLNGDIFIERSQFEICESLKEFSLK